MRCDPAFILTVLKGEDFSHRELQGVRYIDANILLNEVWAVYDIYFTTEFGTIPWWFTDVTTVFFLHGVGPKVSYFATDKLKDFDVVLAPGPYVESKQIPFLKEGAVLYRAGLPVTDCYFLQETFSLPQYLNFNNGKPVLLYAPSWSKDHLQLSIDFKILNALSHQEVCNVIIRPHPNLLAPEKCNGINWREIIAEIMLNNKRIALHAGRGTSIYDVLGCTDILLGDISSIVYEFLVLDRPIILYLKSGVGEFYQSEDFIFETKKACYNIENADKLEAVLLECLSNKEALSAERKTILGKSLHNPGKAIPEIVKLLHEL
jgi:CDP-glycerol glycerophosphotransferase (TagB/SpsB family)